MVYRKHEKTWRHHIVVTATTGEEFERKLNEVEEELALDPDVENVTIVYNTNLGHCAYFDYDKRETRFRNKAEEYESRGEAYCCGDCELFHQSGDRRVRYTTCDAGIPRRTADSYACPEFYEMLECLKRR